jgi:hypothetical protein
MGVSSMRILFSILGLVARLNERLSHYRINFIPLNWIVMVALFVTCSGAFVSLLNALEPNVPPSAVTIADVVQSRLTGHNYVTLRGVMHPEMAIEKKEDHQVVSRWEPLVDPNTKQALMVEVDTDGQLGYLPLPTTVTGRVWPLENELRDKLQDSGLSRNIDLEHMVIQGLRDPGDKSGGLELLLGWGSVLALFVATYLMRYVVFQRTGRRVARTGDSSGYPAAGIDLRLTGSMTLDGGACKRFLNVPAALATLEHGELALVSHIDASSYFMGIRMMKRAGIWASIIRPGTLEDSELGLLYIGLATRPAVRVRYMDAATGKRAVSILSFNTERERQIVIQDLDGFAGHTTTATVVR